MDNLHHQNARKIITLGGLLMTCFMLTYGQHKHLKGPAVKQHRKYLKEGHRVASPVTTMGHERLVGPAAKNPQYHKRDKNPVYQPIKNQSSPARLMGPKAKRTKPVRRPRPPRFVPVKKKIYRKNY